MSAPSSSPDSTGMTCAASACDGYGGVDLMSVAYEIDNSSLADERTPRLGESEILTSRLVDRS